MKTGTRPDETVTTSEEPAAAQGAERIHPTFLDTRVGLSPEFLLRLFQVLALACGAMIIGLSWLGVTYIYRTAMLRDAETAAIAVGDAIFSQERRSLVRREGGAERIHLEPSDFDEMDEKMRQYLLPFRMVKIKIFDDQRRVVYSTDRSVIGRIDSGNAALGRVLGGGGPVSSAEQKNQFTELGGRVIKDAHIVETYVPVGSGGKIIGAFEVYGDITQVFDELEVVGSRAIAVLSFVVIVSLGLLYIPMQRGTRALIHAHHRVSSLASLDFLTGVLNRRSITRRIHEEYSRLRRTFDHVDPVRSIGFVMIDLDHFKHINDTHGHEAGDEVLREAARRMKTALRDADVIGRYGGEEFLVVLADCSIAAAMQVAQRLLESVGDEPVRLPSGGTLKVTVSIGVGALASLEESPEDAIKRADAALYRAKANGRNRVEATLESETVGTFLRGPEL